MRCCICKKEIKGYGNNAFPAGNSTCCDECNIKVVVPYRLLLRNYEKEDTALLVTPNELKLVKPKDKYFTLKELKQSVNGYIELGMEVLPHFLTVVNEEGLIRKFKFNELAYHLFGIEVYGNALIVPKKIFEKPEDD